jgi:hypothetical protein
MVGLRGGYYRGVIIQKFGILWDGGYEEEKG